MFGIPSIDQLEAELSQVPTLKLADEVQVAQAPRLRMAVETARQPVPPPPQQGPPAPSAPPMQGPPTAAAGQVQPGQMGPPNMGGTPPVPPGQVRPGQMGPPNMAGPPMPGPVPPGPPGPPQAAGPVPQPPQQQRPMPVPPVKTPEQQWAEFKAMRQMQRSDSYGQQGPLGAMYRDYKEERDMRPVIEANAKYAQDMAAYENALAGQKLNDLRTLAIGSNLSPQQADALVNIAAGNPDMEQKIYDRLAENNEYIRKENDTEYYTRRETEAALGALTSYGIPEKPARDFAEAIGRGDLTNKEAVELWRSGVTENVNDVVSTMRFNQFADGFLDERSFGVLGAPNQTEAVKKTRRMWNASSYAHEMNLQRMVTEDYLEFGGRILKGNQSEKEWEKVAATRPALDAPPEMWFAFFDNLNAIHIKDAMYRGDGQALDEALELREKLYGTQWIQEQPWFQNFNKEANLYLSTPAAEK